MDESNSLKFSEIRALLPKDQQKGLDFVNLAEAFEKAQWSEGFLKGLDGFNTENQFPNFQEVHRVLLNEDRIDLVGDIFLAMAFMYAHEDNDLAKELYAIEAAKAFIEADRAGPCEQALDLCES